MSTRGRVERLEDGAGGRGGCACPAPLPVYYEDEPRPPSECPSCGRPRTILHVVYEDRREAAEV